MLNAAGRRPLIAALLLVGLTVPGLAATGKTLYERLGGTPAIEAVVNDFVGNVAADKRINHFFAKADPKRVKAKLVEQICAAAGGPCTYTGRDMTSVHKGMGIGEPDWDATIEDLTKSLRKFKVPRKEQKELLGLLGPMKADIVEKH
jgi:hemoglobin